MNLVGIDPSLTSTGFCCAETQIAIARKDRGMHRIQGIRNEVADLLRQVENPVVLIEGYSFGSRNSHAHAAGELGGALRLWMFENEVPYIDIPPTSRAKFATGKGNASKNEVVSAISARTGIAWVGPGADDICDAFVLRQMGLARIGESPYSWPATHMEALVKVDWASVGM